MLGGLAMGLAQRHQNRLQERDEEAYGELAGGYNAAVKSAAEKNQSRTTRMGELRELINDPAAIHSSPEYQQREAEYQQLLGQAPAEPDLSAVRNQMTLPRYARVARRHGLVLPAPKVGPVQLAEPDNFVPGAVPRVVGGTPAPALSGNGGQTGARTPLFRDPQEEQLRVEESNRRKLRAEPYLAEMNRSTRPDQWLPVIEAILDGKDPTLRLRVPLTTGTALGGTIQVPSLVDRARKDNPTLEDARTQRERSATAEIEAKQEGRNEAWQAGYQFLGRLRQQARKGDPEAVKRLGYAEEYLQYDGDLAKLESALQQRVTKEQQADLAVPFPGQPAKLPELGALKWPYGGTHRERWPQGSSGRAASGELGNSGGGAVGLARFLTRNPTGSARPNRVEELVANWEGMHGQSAPPAIRAQIEQYVRTV
jgi:hypothetical protein